MSSYVFIPQRNPKIDYSDATSFGTLVYLFDQGDYNTASQLYVPKVHAELLDKYQPGDYLLLVGDPVLISLCFNAMSQLADGEVNCLKWDKVKSCYYAIKLTNLNIPMEE